MKKIISLDFGTDKHAYCISEKGVLYLNTRDQNHNLYNQAFEMLLEIEDDIVTYMADATETIIRTCNIGRNVGKIFREIVEDEQKRRNIEREYLQHKAVSL